MSGLATGRLAKAICDRCKFKYNYTELSSDPNSPGLRVCAECKDQFDPWRLPARQPEAITMRFPRPDQAIDPPPTYLATADGIVLATADGYDFII